MSQRIRHKIEFGDFQTPDNLASDVCGFLRRTGARPQSIIEPTCGKGSFLRAAANFFPECKQLLGFEINPNHVRESRRISKAKVYCEDFFDVDWEKTLNDFEDTILVIGNPPWVTNSKVGFLGGSNLPGKSNFRQLSGLDAITGKSNFDISEWMMTRLSDRLSGRRAILAMLCKTSVARKVLHHVWSRNLEVARATIHKIDADRHFGASVEACLLTCNFVPGVSSDECSGYENIDASDRFSTLAFRKGRVIADLNALNKYGHLHGTSPLKWRSGVKHDCSRVMELRAEGDGKFRNGMDRIISLEEDCLYPLLKSSEIVKRRRTPSRYVLLTQKRIGENTAWIEQAAPRTWRYLQSNAIYLDRRASSIYKNRPRFSIFGVGRYSFAPWKVAISGFYRSLEFRCIGPVNERPTMVDDTCYFLPCETEGDAQRLVDLLNSESSRGFFRAFVFWDAKRPITAQLLACLDLARLAEDAGAALPIWPRTRQAEFLFDSGVTTRGAK